MKALRYRNPREADIVEVDDYTIGADNEVIVRNVVSCISPGTELTFYTGTSPLLGRDGGPRYPLIARSGAWWMGYASVGEVVETGSAVETVKAGDLVFVKGPHSEYQKVAERHVFKIDGCGADTAAFLELIVIALTGILDAEIRLGETVAVFGLGVLGQLVASMSGLAGARVIGVGRRNRRRMDIAARRGCDPVLTADAHLDERLSEFTAGRRADWVFDATGNVRGLEAAIRAAHTNGEVIVVSGMQQDAAYPLPLGADFHFRRIILRSSQVGGIRPALRHRWDTGRRRRAAYELIPKLDIPSLVTHRIPFTDAPEAFALLDRRPERCLGMLLVYS